MADMKILWWMIEVIREYKIREKPKKRWNDITENKKCTGVCVKWNWITKVFDFK